MAGEEKFGYFRLSEGTEGEDGSLSSGSSWLEVLCVWRWKLTTGCSIFVCEKKWQSHQQIQMSCNCIGESGLSSSNCLKWADQSRPAPTMANLTWGVREREIVREGSWGCQVFWTNPGLSQAKVRFGSWAEPDSYWRAEDILNDGRLNFLSWRRKYSLCWAFITMDSIWLSHFRS